jgi:hypothetical protein
MADDIEKNFISDHFMRFMKHFPFEGDDVLVVLKGHLLIEELLWVFVTDNVSNKDALKKLKDDHNFGFAHLANFAKALNPNKDFNWLWPAIIKLNRIRNGFAHNLEPKGIVDRKKEFIDYVQANDKVSWTDTHIKEFGKLRLAVMGCHRYLELLVRYESMMEAAKKAIPTLLAEGVKPKDEKGGD